MKNLIQIEGVRLAVKQVSIVVNNCLLLHCVETWLEHQIERHMAN
jgi:hypothetical protein